MDKNGVLVNVYVFLNVYIAPQHTKLLLNAP